MFLRFSNSLIFRPFFKTSVAVLFCSSLFVGCSSKEERITKGSEQHLYERAQGHLRSNSWDVAVSTLESLEEFYPFGAYSEQAQLELIFAYYKANEHDAAIASAERFIRLHPQHRNVDYAYYMRGVASFYNDSVFSSFLATDASMRDVGTARDSFAYFDQLIRQYPESPYTLDAQKRMIYLRNTMARLDINVANYYFKRGAYLAAANRGRHVVENMQETPAVPDGLAVMAQAYQLLGMEDLAQNSEKVLIHNFPDHPALKDGKFNYTFGRDKKRSWVSVITFGVFDKMPTIKFDSRKQYQAIAKKRSPALAPPTS
ncbi:MAG: outer membrane protein assembly factor BamD [Flavobacteriales bacterium]|jgi:outer membrane protein assembly factor BamD